MRPIFHVILIATLSLTSTLACGATADQIGIVKSLTGEVLVSRGGSAVSAAANLKLFTGDIIQTGANGKAGLIMEDDTVISMGHDSRLVLEKFLFQPNEKKLSFLVRVLKGTVSFLCGQIAKLAPSQVHIETPYATVGVRGTHLLVQVD